MTFQPDPRLADDYADVTTPERARENAEGLVDAIKRIRLAYGDPEDVAQREAIKDAARAVRRAWEFWTREWDQGGSLKARRRAEGTALTMNALMEMSQE